MADQQVVKRDNEVFEGPVFKALRFFYQQGQRDFTLRVVLAFLIWLVFLFIAHFYNYRNAQIALFEIPNDRLVNSVSLSELFGNLVNFPLHFLAAPLILWPWVKIYSTAYEWTEKVEKKKWGSLITAFLRPALVMVTFLGPSVIFYYIYGSSLDFAAALGSATILFGGVLLFGNLLFSLGEDKKGEAASNHVVGAALFLILMCTSLGGLTVFLLVESSKAYGDRDRLTQHLCDHLSLVSVMTEQSKIGWLISRDENYITIREKEHGVYRTIDIPQNRISEIVYLERFGYFNEKFKAFPDCNLHR